MSEIQNKVVRLCDSVLGHYYLSKRSEEALAIEIKEALALLPPEGETRVIGDGKPYPCGRASRCEDYEPAPPSEKALRDAAILMARYICDTKFKGTYKDVFHSAKYVFATYLGTAPDHIVDPNKTIDTDWADDRERRINSGQVILDEPAPEAPKKEPVPTKKGWTGKPCPACDGTGENNEARKCSACGGTGEEYVSERSTTT
jgi:hypothetical protein